MHKMLIIGYVWPEPTATAAGCRMIQLIQIFKNLYNEIVFASPAVKPDTAFDLSSMDIKEEAISLNDDTFDDFIADLNPNTVMFDRFMMEEQFGWRVAKQCPTALRLLDSEDLHFLRSERILVVKQNKPLPKGMIHSEQAQREIASIYRCDLTITISEFEMAFLIDTYKIPNQQLLYVPFLVEKLNQPIKTFEEKEDFVFIGNFMHAPNRDAVLQLKNVYWAEIRKRFPKANVHVYGGYANQAILQLHNEKQGFLVHGRAEDVNEVMQAAKICIAPIRFGAGLKGKFIDAMINGTPLITTSIGAEGMFGNFNYEDCIADTNDDFINKTVALYSDSSLWEVYQKKGIDVIHERFLLENHKDRILATLQAVQKNITVHRKQNFIGSMLQLQNMKASEYMSRWIMEKNRNSE